VVHQRIAVAQLQNSGGAYCITSEIDYAKCKLYWSQPSKWSPVHRPITQHLTALYGALYILV